MWNTKKSRIKSIWKCIDMRWTFRNIFVEKCCSHVTSYLLPPCFLYRTSYIDAYISQLVLKIFLNTLKWFLNRTFYLLSHIFSLSDTCQKLFLAWSLFHLLILTLSSLSFSQVLFFSLSFSLCFSISFSLVVSLSSSMWAKYTPSIGEALWKEHHNYTQRDAFVFLVEIISGYIYLYVCARAVRKNILLIYPNWNG